MRNVQNTIILLLLLTAVACHSGGSDYGIPVAQSSFEIFVESAIPHVLFSAEKRAIPGFGGTYFSDPCTRVVLTTQPENFHLANGFYTTERTSSNGASCQAALEVEEVEYTWLQLERWYDQTVEALPDQAITGIGIGIRQNQILVGVADEAAGERLRHQLLRLDIPSSAFWVGITGPISPSDPGGSLLVITSTQNEHRPIGGVPVQLYRNGRLIRESVTSSAGQVEFDSIFPGIYHATIDPPAGLVARNCIRGWLVNLDTGFPLPFYLSAQKVWELPGGGRSQIASSGVGC